jgi:hypothetical protein
MLIRFLEGTAFLCVLFLSQKNNPKQRSKTSKFWKYWSRWWLRTALLQNKKIISY